MNLLLNHKDNLCFGLLAVFIVATPLFVESKYYFIVLNVIGLNTLVVVGLNLLIGFAGQISLGHAAFYGLGSYFSGILTVNYGFPLWPAMLAGMLARFVALSREVKHESLRVTLAVTNAKIRLGEQVLKHSRRPM